MIKLLIVLLITGCNPARVITDEDTDVQDGRYDVCQHEENKGTALCP